MTLINLKKNFKLLVQNLWRVCRFIPLFRILNVSTERGEHNKGKTTSIIKIELRPCHLKGKKLWINIYIIIILYKIHCLMYICIPKCVLLRTLQHFTFVYSKVTGLGRPEFLYYASCVMVSYIWIWIHTERDRERERVNAILVSTRT